MKIVRFRRLLPVCLGIGAAILLLYREFPGRWDHLFGPEGQEEAEEAGVEGQMSLWWWSRAYPYPQNMTARYLRAWQQALAMKDPETAERGEGSSGVNGTEYFQGSWNPIGPDQYYGGRVLSIAIDPVNGNNIFIGTASGGIWKTTTAGTGPSAWQPVATGYPVLGVASLVFDPSNSNILYAGTGEVYRMDSTGSTANPGNAGFNVWKARGTYGVGILKSTDGGDTWTQVMVRTQNNLFAIQRLRFDPSNHNILYACATDGLYRSADAGSSWTRILTRTYVSDVVINASDSKQLVAAVGNLENTDKGIYRSTDGGTTWTRISSGLPSGFNGFIRFSYVPGDAATIVAGIGVSENAAEELYRSTDFGASWGALSNSRHCLWQYWCAHAVAIDPANTSKIIYGGVRLYAYTLASSHTTIGSNVHDDVHDIEFDPANPDNIYVACDGGVYRSTDAGASFSAVNDGLQAVQFYASIGVSSTDPDLIVGGLQDNGVVRYNGGKSWSGFPGLTGTDGASCAIDPTNDNNILASGDARSVYLSTNRGGSASGKLSYWGSVADSRTAFVAPMAISRSNPSVMYVASDNLHKSSNGGGSFSGNSYSSATSYIEARHKTAIALAVSPTDANKIYVSTSPFAQYDNDVDNIYVNPPANVLKSSDGGTSFQSIRSNLPDRFVMDFAISPGNDDSVWVVLGGFGTAHVYVTGDGGGSWTPVGTGLPDVPHNAILLDPNKPDIIYAGNDLGVYVSPDKGNTWYDFNNGLWDATLIMDLQATADNKLVAATHGKGAFESDLYSVALPVRLVRFEGTNNGPVNHLRWVTAREENMQAFELERSTDGSRFQKIAVLPAKQTGGAVYDYDDDIGGLPGIPTFYYRLRIIDKSGAFTYSAVLRLHPSRQPGIRVLTNPFGNSLSVLFNSNRRQTVSLELLDAAGRLLMQKRYSVQNGPNRLVMGNLFRLPAGTYIVEARSATGERFVTKALKD